ncbi:MAG TPA: deoxyribodipyrimidine photo-lyase [Candidatus Omnitrophota bacterium]|nr:deoxyribodipyrimidine photo-lyase [Candidatus Omnitrophota bacterium]HQL41117.1 deoxyribodipyrimidine photo-lyase [Candidatus Omnitrophota bacterium]
MNPGRIRILKAGKRGSGPVVYWMSRDQRFNDNWALIFAQELALKNAVPLGIVFALASKFLNATRRHYDFMLKGLIELQKNLAAKNIPFFLLSGNPSEEIFKFVKKHEAGALVCDFDPLRVKRAWKSEVARKIDIPFYEVDAHNIVPCWVASPKQEFGAYTIRPKINRILDIYLKDFPKVTRHRYSFTENPQAIDVDCILAQLKCGQSAGPVAWIKPGEKNAAAALKKFISKKLSKYDAARNDPNLGGQSDLSPYLHFGQLSAQRVALAVARAKANENSKQAFLEELVIRRELSDNFCFYNKSYDNIACAPNWARTTFMAHAKDRREYLYTLKEFEDAKTHDQLWNAAQMEMMKTGKMHGFMRMYWAKKILEWTPSPKKAFEIAVYLNDKYSLDGRDPNGYAGIAWSVAGVHDRAWGERAIFGKVRYMSYNGCKNKFDIEQYIEKIEK